MPQQSLADFVDDMEKAGLLVRIKEEKRVDELGAEFGSDAPRQPAQPRAAS